MSDSQFVERRATPPMEGWHLDKKVPLGLIFAMVMQAAMALWAFADVKKDVDLVKAEVQVLHQRDNSLSDQFKEALKLLQDQFARLDAKLDRLIERQK